MTVRRTLRGDHPAASGYRRLVDAAGEPHSDRTDLAPAPVHPGESLVTIAHISDMHVCDAQSPARAEFLDRWADPDSPVADQLEEVGTYRAQELLTAQVAEAMTRALNSVEAGPVAGAPVDFAVVTGDNTDNAQFNELQWYLALLEGGPVHPDSGDLNRYEGVADDEVPDERFWHPHAGQPDLPRLQYGLPSVPGLLDAVRAPFEGTGLAVPWFAVHGNHDRMLQGTIPGRVGLRAVAVGGFKPIALPQHWTPDAIASLLAGLALCDPAAIEALGEAQLRAVTADPSRRITTRQEFLDAHFGGRARPIGHGFQPGGPAYYRHDHDGVTLLVLDSVDEHGGWHGSLDAAQLDWLETELAAADAERRYVILASHHPLETFVNSSWTRGSPRRVLAAEFDAVLARHPSVVLWLNGHSHMTVVTPHATWWEITAPSLIDWPQQSRIVEVIRNAGTLTVATTMLDHHGGAPWDGSIDNPLALAALSRELSANDWQWRATPLEEHPRAGAPSDRNVLLHLTDPWS
jgi:metallophosphoesterase (TIGR03767 family)